MATIKGGKGIKEFIKLIDTPSSYSSHSLKGVRVNTGETALEFYDPAGEADEKVAVDSEAIAGYLGAASNDGVLRVGSPLIYTDGGDFITLDIDETLIDHDVLTNTHNLTTDIDHDTITNTHNLTTDIDHTTIQNIGTTSHADIDTHIADDTIHFTTPIEDGSAAGQMTFWNGSQWKHTETSELFWDDTNKRVGIKTASPQATLHLGQPASGWNVIRVDSYSGNVGAALDFYNSAGSWIAGVSYRNQQDRLDLNAGAAPRITILSDGKVGIGTTTPSELLDVDGNIAVSGTVDTVDVAGLKGDFDSHIADGTIHFLEGAISHLNILNIGEYTHSELDDHVKDTTIHFTEASISHDNIADVSADDHHAQTHASTHHILGADPMNHDSLFGFVANEHIDWTNATDNFKTTGTGEIGGTTIDGDLYMKGGDIKTDRWIQSDTNTLIGVDVCGAGNLSENGENSGLYNSAYGNAALRSITTGHGNTAVGYNVMYYTTTGYNNVAYGYNALLANTEGYENIAIGNATLEDNTTGYNNVGIGNNALWMNVTGINNVAIGKSAGAGTLHNSNSNNIFIGYQAGDNVSTGSNNIVIGYDKDLPAGDTSNHLNIGGIIFGDLGETKALRLGQNTTNYAEFKSDGELNLYGTARVERHWIIDAKRFKMPAAHYPSEGFTGLFYTLDFDKQTDESAYVMDHIPFRKVAGGDIEVSIDWCWSGVTLAYDVVWGIEYKSIKEGEAVAGAGTTITEVGSIRDPDILERTTFTTTISGALLEADDDIAIRVFRSAEDPADNLNADAKLVNVHFHFIADKLGKATEVKPQG